MNLHEYKLRFKTKSAKHVKFGRQFMSEYPWL